MRARLARRANYTRTENGALTNRTSGNFCLDFFAACGALRNADAEEKFRRFIRAYAEDPLLALRALFYARDIRKGLGERSLFRDVITKLACLHPETVIKNLALIPEFGRWDDLLSLLGTPCEAAAVQFIRAQLDADAEALKNGESVSLLAKWLPSVNTSSPEARLAAKRLCRLLKMSERDYRRTLSPLRLGCDVLERRLCRKSYRFDYSKQPSGAMLKYRRAFLRRDKKRFARFVEQVKLGKQTMHACTLYPYEIIRRCIDTSGSVLDGREKDLSEQEIAALDAAWKSLPVYSGARNALAVIDGSGSMYWGGNPMPVEVALSLGIYFAEHCTGRFKDHFITFSRTPQLVRLKGENIADRALYCASFNECSNTNLRAVFELILQTALTDALPQSELPETLYIISDMEFDVGTVPDKTLFEEMRDLYSAAGYRLPALVYWNVDSRQSQFPVTMDEHGVALVSGASPSVFEMVISQEVDPMSYMLSVLNAERYSRVRV